MSYDVRNIDLAAQGLKKIDWARRHMPVLNALEDEMRAERPFDGMVIALSIHLEAKTARLALMLREGGAEVHVTGSNPLSTKDDIAAALADLGMNVYAYYNPTPEEYHAHLIRALSDHPHIVIDDGGELVAALHDEVPEYADRVIGGCEETTTGVLRLKARAIAGKLHFPMMLINDSQCKYLFDNRYGTGQSVFDGIMRTTNALIAGSTVVVAGYGWCGRGVAMRAAGLGANVIVTEVDPVKAIEAVMDGFRVMPMIDAAPLGDLFITVTGCSGVIRAEHMQRMKSGAMLCNAGHFDVEVDVAIMREAAVETWEARDNIQGFKMPCGRILYLLAQGRLVNLAAGDGHPMEIMDLSFSLQALGAREMAINGARYTPGAHNMPRELDNKVAVMKLNSLGVSIDELNAKQAAYLAGYGA